MIHHLRNIYVSLSNTAYNRFVHTYKQLYLKFLILCYALQNYKFFLKKSITWLIPGIHNTFLSVSCLTTMFIFHDGLETVKLMSIVYVNLLRIPLDLYFKTVWKLWKMLFDFLWSLSVSWPYTCYLLTVA